jgi:5'-3' exonuclease
MGTPHLTTYLKSKGYTCSNIDFNDMKSKSIAIDVSIWAYKANYSRSSKNPHPMYIYFLKMIKNFIKYNMTFMFVFDGIPSELKLDTINGRVVQLDKYKAKLDEIRKLYEYNNKRIQSGEVIEDIALIQIQLAGEIKKLTTNINIVPLKEEIDFLKKMFSLLSIPYVVIDNHDAEGLCGYLSKKGYIDYVMTTDSDGLVFNCNNILYDYKHDSSKLTIKHLCHVLQTLELSLDNIGISKLINLAYCCGTDYNNHIYRRRIAKDHLDISKSKNCGFDIILNNIQKAFKPDEVENRYNLYLKIYNEFTFDYSTIFGDMTVFDFTKRNPDEFINNIRKSIIFNKDDKLFKELSLDTQSIVLSI